MLNLIFVSLIFSSLSLNAQRLKVATYNIRYENPEDIAYGNGWKERCPVICNLVQFHDFDIFGAQEVLHGQLADMLNGLQGYSYLGVGRDDGKEKGEYAPIFYKKDKFDLLQSGHFWMSSITDRPNKGWDAVLPRICTWGKFFDKKCGFSFWFFNLHMDHIGVEARKQSAALVLKTIKEKCGNDPVILTGDFNVDQHNESYALINTSGILKDSYELTKIRYALNGTFNNFESNLATESRIDHIFVTSKFKVLRYGILTDSYRTKPENGKKLNPANFSKEVSNQQNLVRLPSDHYPVEIELDYSK